MTAFNAILLGLGLYGLSIVATQGPAVGDDTRVVKAYYACAFLIGVPVAALTNGMYAATPATRAARAPPATRAARAPPATRAAPRSPRTSLTIVPPQPVPRRAAHRLSCCPSHRDLHTGTHAV